MDICSTVCFLNFILLRFVKRPISNTLQESVNSCLLPCKAFLAIIPRLCMI